MRSLTIRTLRKAAVAVMLAACDAGRIVAPLGPAPAAPRTEVASTPSDFVGPAVVISQVYGGGGNANSVWKNDFVELYNRTSSAVNVDGWSIQYASSGGSTWQVTTLAGSIPANGYYLVQEAAQGGGTTALPLAEASGSIPLSATAGKVALLSVTDAASGTCPAGAVDEVSFGSATDCGFKTTKAPSNTNAVLRAGAGCAWTGDLGLDFATGTPTPRNTSSATRACTLVPIGPLDHVTVTGGTSTVPQGGTLQFSAVGQDAGNHTIRGATVTWQSSDPTIATIDNGGKLTAVLASATPVTLTATAVSGDLTRTATRSVTITQPTPTASVTVSPATWQLKAGATKQLTATALDADGHTTITSWTWSSSDESIATVDATGIVTGKKIGPATITVTSQNGVSATSAITVTSAASLSLTSGKAALALGMQTQFFFAGSDANGTALTAITWSTSDPSIITVDEHGVVTGRGMGSATLIGTAPDQTTATTPVTVYIAEGATGPVRLGHNEEFGEPKDADPSDDIIIHRAQYTVSYNPQRGGANWVSWNIDATHLGTNGRCTGTCYSADTALVNAHVTAYTTADWVSGNTYDRGHMAPSADWTSSEADNNTTFFLSNFLPQTHDMNAGPWERLEKALRDSVLAGREAYVIAGGIFKNGTGLGTLLDKGRIAIPNSTWKIAVLTPKGTGINADGTLPDHSTVLAVDMPNVYGIIGEGWEQYKTTVSALEQETGYDFLALLADNVECKVEVRNCTPAAHITGVGLSGGNEGQTLSFSAATSTDTDAGDVLSYAWTVNGQDAGTQPTLSYTFANNGAYALRLIATDNHGAADTTSATVSIANVAPVVSGIAGAALIRGEQYASAGTFTDPGTDRWTATVNYGDGAGAQPLALSDKSFALSHGYAVAGSYPVTVTVSDGDGGVSSSTATVTVASAADAIGTLSGNVSALASAGSLTRGESNALDASLRNALKSLKSDTPAAANELEAFVNKVEAMQGSGRLGAATASTLISYAQRIIASIG